MTITIENLRKYDGPGEYVGRAVSRRKIKGTPLGNIFKLKPTATDEERQAAVEQYAMWLDEQLSDHESPQSQEIARLAQLYKASGTLTLMCWCAPKPCHASVVRERIIKASESSG